MLQFSTKFSILLVKLTPIFFFLNLSVGLVKRLHLLIGLSLYV